MFNLRYSALVSIALIIDQACKWLAKHNLNFHSEIPLIPNTLALQLVHNYGAAYGIFQNQKFFLISVSIGVLIFCVIFQNKLGHNTFTKIALSFLVAGTIGNLVDRIVHGYVIDFIVIYIIPVFNWADVFINIGIIGLIVDMFFHRDTETKPQRS